MARRPFRSLIITCLVLLVVAPRATPAHAATPPPPVEAGVAVTIPLGTHFQFRALGAEPMTAVGITMPPWPGEGEAYEVPGTW